MRKVQIKDIFYSNQESIKLSNYDFINYLDTSSITMNHIDNIQKLYIGEETIPSRAKRLIKKDTIVYSSVRPNLKHYGIIKNPLNNMVASTGFITLDIQDETKNDANYMYYNLTQDKYTDYLHTIACNNVSSYPSINPSDIEDMEIEIETDIGNQKKIAKLFVDIDKKIELNNKINSELENIAKTLYDYWFVQFEFPDENERPYKSSGGKMVYNKELKREIPTTFERKELRDFCNIFTGKKDVKMAVENGNYPFFSCAPDPLKSNDYIFDGNAILVAGNGSYTGRVSYYKGKFDLYQRTYACTLKNDDNNFIPFLYHFMKFFFEPQYKGGTHGSAIPYIVLGDLANLGIPYNEKIINKFNNIVKPVLNAYFKNSEENKQLMLLRDFILPMLMNGQVTIRQ